MHGPPPLFDALLHPEGLEDVDLESMRLFGVEAALCVPGVVAEPGARTLRAHLGALVGRQLRRLERAGIRGYAAVGVSPRSLPRRGLEEVLSHLPDLFAAPRVVALGEVGLATGEEREQEALLAQLELARRLKVPVVVSTPSREKARLTRRTLALLQEVALPPSRVLVTGASATTAPLIRALGYGVGLTLHPDALSAERAVALVRKLGAEGVVLGSGAGLGASDILALPRATHLLVKARLSERLIARVSAENVARLLRVPAA